MIINERTETFRGVEVRHVLHSCGTEEWVHQREDGVFILLKRILHSPHDEGMRETVEEYDLLGRRISFRGNQGYWSRCEYFEGTHGTVMHRVDCTGVDEWSEWGNLPDPKKGEWFMTDLLWRRSNRPIRNRAPNPFIFGYVCEE